MRMDYQYDTVLATCLSLYTRTDLTRLNKNKSQESNNPKTNLYKPLNMTSIRCLFPNKSNCFIRNVH